MMLIAYEGLDQSGKETQARALSERVRQVGHVLIEHIGQLRAHDVVGPGEGFVIGLLYIRDLPYLTSKSVRWRYLDRFPT